MNQISRFIRAKSGGPKNRTISAFTSHIIYVSQASQSGRDTSQYLFSSDISFDIKNMAIRKILDSYRVNKEEKEKVKALRTILKEKKK